MLNLSASNFNLSYRSSLVEVYWFWSCSGFLLRLDTKLESTDVDLIFSVLLVFYGIYSLLGLIISGVVFRLITNLFRFDFFTGSFSLSLTSEIFFSKFVFNSDFVTFSSDSCLTDYYDKDFCGKFSVCTIWLIYVHG